MDAASSTRFMPWRRWRYAARRTAASLAQTFIPPGPFSEPAVEAAFLAHYGRRFAPLRRVGIAFGCVMWAGYALWDVQHAPHPGVPFLQAPVWQLLALRGLSLAILIAIGMVSLRPCFHDDRIAHVLLLAGTGTISLTLIGMTLLLGEPAGYIDYFVAIYLVLIFEFAFLHLRAKPVLLQMIILIALVQALQHMHLLGIPFHFLLPDHFLGSTLFFSSFFVIGGGVCIKFERYARRQYQQSQALAAANSALQMKNDLLAREKDEHASKALAMVELKEEQRALAARLNHEKSEFLANAAHDLRQPLFGLALSLESMREALARHDPAEAARLLPLAQLASRRMNVTFNAILDLSRLESGFIKPAIVCFDVRELLAEVVADLQQFADSKRVALRLRMATGHAQPLLAASDRVLLGRAIRNLVSNGIKYGRADAAPAPAVILGAVRLQGRIRIDVTDNGIGIPCAEWERVFKPFVQLHNASRDPANGLGLGLSIVNAMMSILEGHRLEFKSCVGKGTRFSIDTPRATQLAPAGGQEPPGNGSGLALRGRYIVLVESDQLVRAAMEALFVQWDIVADCVATPDALHGLLDDLERIPDLVICQSRFPDGRTAHDVRSALRHYLQQVGGAHAIPMLALCGEPELPPAGAGCAAVLPRPVDPLRLKETIAALVAAGGHRQAAVSFLE